MKTAHIIQNYWRTSTAVQQAAAYSGTMSLAHKLAWQDVLRRQLNSSRQLKILDVNTRTGIMAMLMAQMRHRVIGVDQTTDLLAVARQRAAENKLNCRFIQAAPDMVTFPDATFDVVTILHDIHEISDPAKTFATWKQLLKPSGRLIMIMDDTSNLSVLRRQRAAYQVTNQTPAAMTYWHIAQQQPLWQAPADAISGLLAYTKWENIKTTTLGGQLTRTGVWRQQKYAVGYVVITAERSN